MRLTQSPRELSSSVSRIRCAELARLWLNPIMSIMYTHFGKGFYQDGVDRQFQRLMHRLSKKNGWFVPVSTVLDYIMTTRGHHNITEKERKRLERKWLLSKVIIGPT